MLTNSDATARMRRRVCCRCGLEFRTYEVAEADWKLTQKVVAVVDGRRSQAKGNI